MSRHATRVGTRTAVGCGREWTGRCPADGGSGSRDPAGRSVMIGRDVPALGIGSERMGVTFGPGGPEARRVRLGRLSQAHIHRLEPLRTLLKIELHRLALLERAESVHLDGGVVHEYIGPAIRFVR